MRSGGGGSSLGRRIHACVFFESLAQTATLLWRIVLHSFTLHKLWLTNFEQLLALSAVSQRSGPRSSAGRSTTCTTHRPPANSERLTVTEQIDGKRTRQTSIRTAISVEPCTSDSSRFAGYFSEHVHKGHVSDTRARRES